MGLSLMGTTRFKLFSSTGPSVAIGLAITLAASLTLTPALLIILARIRPRAFAGLTAPSSGFWERIARAALARPLTSWLATILIMAPLAILGLRSGFIQDVMTEMPRDTTSVRNLRWLSTKFDVGKLSPLTVVLDSDSDLRTSQGLALIDDFSRFLARQRRLLEIRSATQPLGSTAPLDPARLSERLGAVNAGFARIESGSKQLQEGLTEGAAKLRAALWFEGRIGALFTGVPGAKGHPLPAKKRRAGANLLAVPGLSAWPVGTQTPDAADKVPETDPRESCSRS